MEPLLPGEIKTGAVIPLMLVASLSMLAKYSALKMLLLRLRVMAQWLPGGMPPLAVIPQVLAAGLPMSLRSSVLI